MNIQQALSYIDGTLWFGSRPGLERTEELLDKLGRPQDGLKFVHIAGTNGKGSCAAMLASIFRAAGYRTGLYTSPYLFRFHERMQVNGEPIGDEDLAELVTRIQPLADGMADHPTEFELITAAALLWFARQRCDIVVLEVGLGGRLDATNVIGAPEAAVIMNIGLDHTQILGDTLEKIAAEKAGIFKPGCDAVCYQLPESVYAVLERKARETGCSLRAADFPSCSRNSTAWRGRASSIRASPMLFRFWASISCATPPWCWRPWRSCAAGAGSWIARPWSTAFMPPSGPPALSW